MDRMVESVLEIGKGGSRKNGPETVCEFTIVNVNPEIEKINKRRNEFVQIVT